MSKGIKFFCIGQGIWVLVHRVSVGIRIIPGRKAERVGADAGKSMWYWGKADWLNFSSD